MLERLVLLSDAVHKVLSESDKKELREMDLPASVIYQLREVADTLKPLCTVMQGMGGENYTSISIFEPILSKLKSKTLVAKDTDTPVVHELKTDALKNLKKLYKKPEMKSLMVQATLLDPITSHWQIEQTTSTSLKKSCLPTTSSINLQTCS